MIKADRCRNNASPHPKSHLSLPLLKQVQSSVCYSVKWRYPERDLEPFSVDELNVPQLVRAATLTCAQHDCNADPDPGGISTKS